MVILEICNFLFHFTEAQLKIPSMESSSPGFLRCLLSYDWGGSNDSYDWWGSYSIAS